MKLFERHTHSDRLERWLGTEQTNQLVDAMRDWYGPPIHIMGIPGHGVRVARGGDFLGPMQAGGLANLQDYLEQHTRAAVRRWNEKQARTAGMGFSSWGDLISEATSGKSRSFSYAKSGATGVVAATNSLWRVGAQPAAGAAAAAAPGGTVPTDATTGAHPFTNPSGGDTQHLIRGSATATVAAQTLLVYDRIFAVAKTMSSTATEAVTGVPTRYQSTTPGDPDYAGGNFLFIECGTALGATAHNWTTCQYTDQDGNATITLPSVTGNSGNIANRLDQPTGGWFAPLASGDYGIKALTQMQCSASVTGAIDFVIGHPLAFLPIGIANMVFPLDLIALPRVFDDAAIAFLEVTKSATTATNYTIFLESVAG